MTTAQLESPISDFADNPVDEEVAHARQVLIALVKTIHAFRIYPPSNPTPQTFLTAFWEQLTAYLLAYGILRFSIDEFRLLVHDQAIYENTDLRTSLAFLLYKDGIRSLYVTDDVRQEEITRLIELFAYCESIDYLEDDIATLLWEQDFDNIGYAAIDEFLAAADIFIDEQHAAPACTSVPAPDHLHDTEMIGDEADAAEEPAPTESLQVSDDEMMPEATVIDVASLPVSHRHYRALASSDAIFLLTPADEDELHRQVQDAVRPHFDQRVADILVEMLTLSPTSESLQSILAVIDKALNYSLTAGDLAGVANLARLTSHALTTAPIWQHDAIHQFIHDFGQRERMLLLRDTLLKSEERFDEVRAFFLLLPLEVTPALIELLGEFTSADIRNKMCDVVAEKGVSVIPYLLPFLQDTRWFLVRNVVYILGRIGDARSVPQLERMADHSHLEVQREALRALGNMGGRSLHVFLKAVRSADPYLRSLAAFLLGKAGGISGLQHLLDIVQSRGFRDRDPVEIHSFFTGIGVSGAREAIHPLQRLLFQKSWFQQRGLHEIHKGAAEALAILNREEALSILQSGAASANESIRTACQWAIAEYIH